MMRDNGVAGLSSGRSRGRAQWGEARGWSRHSEGIMRRVSFQYSCWEVVNKSGSQYQPVEWLSVDTLMILRQRESGL